MQIKAHHVKQGVITTLLWALIGVMESISAYGAYHAEADHIRGAQMAAMTVICAAIAFLGFGLAGRLKEDERPETARRARAARIVAASFLILGPIPFLGSALKMERLDREWSAYSSSVAYQADQQMALDEMADRYDREAARQRIIQPVNANLDPADGEFWVALLIQTLGVLPLIMPPFVGAVALQLIFGRSGTVNPVPPTPAFRPSSSRRSRLASTRHQSFTHTATSNSRQSKPAK